MDRIDELIRDTPLPYQHEFEDKTVAFVHAKGNSTRVVSKNRRILGDRPLFCHAVQNALSSRLVDVVVIDSDDSAILDIGREHGAVPLRRPPELATNLATGDDLAYWQASNFPLSRVCIQVIPTAPFLKPDSIDGAVRMLLDNPELDSVAGVYEEALYIWLDGKPAYYNDDGTIPNSFELGKTVYETTGMYAGQTKAILRTKRRLNPACVRPYVLQKIETIDINTEEDFAFAETVWKGMQ